MANITLDFGDLDKTMTIYNIQKAMESVDPNALALLRTTPSVVGRVSYVLQNCPGTLDGIWMDYDNFLSTLQEFVSATCARQLTDDEVEQNKKEFSLVILYYLHRFWAQFAGGEAKDAFGVRGEGEAPAIVNREIESKTFNTVRENIVNEHKNVSGKRKGTNSSLDSGKKKQKMLVDEELSIEIKQENLFFETAESLCVIKMREITERIDQINCGIATASTQIFSLYHCCFVDRFMTNLENRFLTILDQKIKNDTFVISQFHIVFGRIDTLYIKILQIILNISYGIRPDPYMYHLIMNEMDMIQFLLYQINTNS